jgi:hypothetical protein
MKNQSHIKNQSVSAITVVMTSKLKQRTLPTIFVGNNKKSWTAQNVCDKHFSSPHFPQKGK